MASMLDFPLMLWVKLPVVDRILPQSTKCATGVDHEGWGGDSKLRDSPGIFCPLICKNWHSMFALIRIV